MKNIAFVLGIFLAITPLAALAQFGEDGNGIWSIKLTYAGLGSFFVGNMPLEVRSVPIHPDDSYAGQANWAPLPQTRFKSIGMPGLGLVRNFQFKSFKISAGLDWIICIEEDQERNYTNAPGTDARGGGAALTFVRLYERGIVPATQNIALDWLDNLSPEVGGEWRLSDNNQLYLGASVSYLRLLVENGWDRFNADQIDNVFNFGQYLPVSLYFRWNNYSLGLFYPIEINRTAIGQEANLRINPSFAVKLVY